MDFGAGRDPEGIADILAAAAVPHELLTAAQAADRWPQFRFDGPVLHHPDAGTVDADATVAAAVRRAAGLGARVLTGTRVTGAEILDDGRVALRSNGPTVVADTVVVASGAWLPQLAAPLGISAPLPPLRVTQQQVFHFRRRNPETTTWPVFVHADRLNLYGLPLRRDGGPLPAFKVAQHDEGTPHNCRHSHRSCGSRLTRQGRRVGGTHAPGPGPHPRRRGELPLHQHPRRGLRARPDRSLRRRVPVLGPRRQVHPLIGAMAADLALGRAEPHPRFALRTSRRTAAHRAE